MKDHEDPSFSHGSQPVPEEPTPPPGGGRSALQVAVLVIAALAILGAIVWLLVPLGA